MVKSFMMMFLYIYMDICCLIIDILIAVSFVCNIHLHPFEVAEFYETELFFYTNDMS